MISSNQQFQQMLQRLSAADRAIYARYMEHRHRLDSDTLLSMAKEAEDPELGRYLENESWDEFRREEQRYFDCD